jgi:ribosome-binding protein aMBF1 (putative translation factor)
MNRIGREVLALFVSARRKHLINLTPIQLAKQLQIEASQIRAVERGQVISQAAAAVLGQWCGIHLVDGAWIAIKQNNDQELECV